MAIRAFLGISVHPKYKGDSKQAFIRNGWSHGGRVLHADERTK